MKNFDHHSNQPFFVCAFVVVLWLIAGLIWG